MKLISKADTNCDIYSSSIESRYYMTIDLDSNDVAKIKHFINILHPIFNSQLFEATFHWANAEIYHAEHYTHFEALIPEEKIYILDDNFAIVDFYIPGYNINIDCVDLVICHNAFYFKCIKNHDGRLAEYYSNMLTINELDSLVNND